MVVAAQVIEQIRQMFRSGVLQSGQKLPPEQEFAHQLAVNRPALRTALRALTQAGVLQRGSGGGLYAAGTNALEGDAPNPSAILKLYAHKETIEVRKIVEVAAVTLAVQRAKSNEIMAMRKTHEALSKTLSDSQRFVLADVAFHRAIADAAGNGMLDSLMQSLWAMISGFNLALLISRPEREAVLEAHERILTAIEQRNASEAARLMGEHLDSMLDIMRRQYERAQPDHSL